MTMTFCTNGVTWTVVSSALAAAAAAAAAANAHDVGVGHSIWLQLKQPVRYAMMLMTRAAAAAEAVAYALEDDSSCSSLVQALLLLNQPALRALTSFQASCQSGSSSSSRTLNSPPCTSSIGSSTGSSSRLTKYYF
jgi:hypothetical protein